MKKTKLPYAPTKVDLAVLIVALFCGLTLTGIVFPILVSTDTMPLFLIMLFFMLMLLLTVVVIQGLISYFYFRVITEREKNRNAAKRNNKS